MIRIQEFFALFNVATMACINSLELNFISMSYFQL